MTRIKDATWVSARSALEAGLSGINVAGKVIEAGFVDDGTTADRSALPSTLVLRRHHRSAKQREQRQNTELYLTGPGRGRSFDLLQSLLLAISFFSSADVNLEPYELVRASQRNALSVRLELQADRLAGVWGPSTEQRKILEAGDVEEAMCAAAAVGDDRLQRQSPVPSIPTPSPTAPRSSAPASSIAACSLATLLPAILFNQEKSAYCSVTSTWITAVPFCNGSRALPTTAPTSRLRSVPVMAWPGVEDVTSKSPT